MNNSNRPHEPYQEGPKQAYPQQGQPGGAPPEGFPGQPPYQQAPPQNFAQTPYGQPPHGQPPQQPYPPQQPPYAPQQGPAGGPPPQGVNYAKGPARPQHKSDTEVKSMFAETWDWVKGIFSPDFTKVVDKAKKTDNQFTWAVVLLVYFLLLPFFKTFNYLRWGGGFARGFLSGFLVLIRGNLTALVVFIVVAGVLTLSLAIFKDYDKWYRPLNAAAAILIPRVLFLPVSSLLSLIGVSVIDEFVTILSACIKAITIFMFLKFLYPYKDKKNAVWTMTGMLALVFVLLNFAWRIV